MARKMVLLSLLLTAAMACGGSKTPVVVVVSMDRVAQESVRAKRLIGEVEAFAKSVEDKLNRTAEQLQVAAQDPRRSREELGSMQAQWDQLRQEAERQVDLRRQQAEEEKDQAAQPEQQGSEGVAHQFRRHVATAHTTQKREQGFRFRQDDLASGSLCFYSTPRRLTLGPQS